MCFLQSSTLRLLLISLPSSSVPSTTKNGRSQNGHFATSEHQCPVVMWHHKPQEPSPLISGKAHLRMGQTSGGSRTATGPVMSYQAGGFERLRGGSGSLCVSSESRAFFA